MMDPDIRRPSRNLAQPEQRPDAIRSVLCVYCRTDKFVYWPPASRPPSSDCPGCQQRDTQPATTLTRWNDWYDAEPIR
jgi:hypothetical protein